MKCLLKTIVVFSFLLPIPMIFFAVFYGATDSLKYYTTASHAIHALAIFIAGTMCLVAGLLKKQKEFWILVGFANLLMVCFTLFLVFENEKLGICGPLSYTIMFPLYFIVFFYIFAIGIMTNKFRVDDITYKLRLQNYVFLSLLIWFALLLIHSYLFIDIINNNLAIFIINSSPIIVL